MGLYDRDYMKERTSKSSRSGASKDTKYIIAILIAFILGVIVGKII